MAGGLEADNSIRHKGQAQIETTILCQPGITLIDEKLNEKAENCQKSGKVVCLVGVTAPFL